MPYIGTAERQLLDPSIEAVSIRIAKVHTARPGDMNYAISQLIRKVYGEKLKYHDYNEIIGILECCKEEFYRSRVAVYEEKKKILNGDLYLDKP